MSCARSNCSWRKPAFGRQSRRGSCRPRVAERTGRPCHCHPAAGRTYRHQQDNRPAGSSSAALLNALKYITGIPDSVDLISPEVIRPIMHPKKHLGNRNPRIRMNYCWLSIRAVTDRYASLAWNRWQA